MVRPGSGRTGRPERISQPLGLIGKRSIAVLTDNLREPLERAGRRYTALDGRSPEKFGKIVEKLASLPDWIGVIDGGGNRPEMDRRFYEMSELVLLPFRDSHEDIRTVRNDLEAFPKAWGIPSQWPTNPWQQMAAERTLDKLMQDYRPRLLDPIYSACSSKLLLETQVPPELPNALNNVCRRLAWQVLGLLERSEQSETRQS